MANVFQRLYYGDTSIDFMRRARYWIGFSLLLIVTGAGSLLFRGLNFGLEFEGGTAWEVPASNNISVTDIRDALKPVGLGSAKIQTIRAGDETRLRVQAGPEQVKKGKEATDKVTDALAKLVNRPAREVSVSEVGPSWGKEISNKALRALIFFLIAITIYISLRFELKMALATLSALFHDILVTIGVYSLTGFEVTPATVIAILTILGYSIYDGIVVFDKIDENTRGLAGSGRMSYSQMVNVSLNQVLMRTLNTAITALFPLLSLLIVGSLVLGVTTLQEFALALLIGLGASSYSSIFIASPVLVWLKQREPRYAALKAKAVTPALVPSGAGAPVDQLTESSTGPRPTSSGSAPSPRGRKRKKGKRRRR